MNNKNALKKYFLTDPNKIAKLFGKIYSKFIFDENGSRLIKAYTKDDYAKIVDQYGYAPENSSNNLDNVCKIIKTFVSGAVNWKSKNLLYNVGAPVNTYALIANAIALDANVYNINDGLSGNMLAAERSVVIAMANLAGVKKEDAAGVFTFGGTATNLYAIKLGLSKASPDTRTKGLIGHKIKIFITEDAHFSHTRSADWLGIGSDNVEIIEPNLHTRESLLSDLEMKMRNAVNGGYKIPALIINGGTTYSHTIDDIEGFVTLRDRIVAEYDLDYKPHVHVDSVIGWAWLAFCSYDFEKNHLHIDKHIVQTIKDQTDRISKIKYADSWGIDFHKGVGSCPVNSSLFMVNNCNDLNYISRKLDPNIKTHQLATDFSHFSPVDYTLETSRSGGSCLSALVMLQTEGQDGIRIHLSNLILAIDQLASLFAQNTSISLIHKKRAGYVLMIRLYPPNIDKSILENEIEDSTNNTIQIIEKVNNYNKSFFSFDLKGRMSRNNDFEYSFSGEFLKTRSGKSLSALKFYPTSPNFSESDVEHIYKTILTQKEIFDQTYE